jgi:hypothetical protein
MYVLSSARGPRCLLLKESRGAKREEEISAAPSLGAFWETLTLAKYLFEETDPCGEWAEAEVVAGRQRRGASALLFAVESRVRPDEVAERRRRENIVLTLL